MATLNSKHKSEQKLHSYPQDTRRLRVPSSGQMDNTRVSQIIYHSCAPNHALPTKPSAGQKFQIQNYRTMTK